MGDIDGVNVQIDDVLVHRRDQVQYDNRSHQVFEQITRIQNNSQQSEI